MSPIVRPVRQPSADEQTTVSVRETCPCGATYISGRHRDPVIYTAWATHHAQHGYQWEKA